MRKSLPLCVTLIAALTASCGSDSTGLPADDAGAGSGSGNGSGGTTGGGGPTRGGGTPGDNGSPDSGSAAGGGPGGSGGAAAGGTGGARLDAGSGGASGMGGAGNGGASGMGGAGNGGATGSGGTGGAHDAGPAPDVKLDLAAADAPPGKCDPAGICTTLENQYAAAYQAARVCSPTMLKQCEQRASTGLACPNCQGWVNSTAELDAIRAKYDAQGCVSCSRPCLAVLCVKLGTGVCTPNGTPTTFIVAPPRPVPGYACTNQFVATP
jgi:hypothetical protein